MLERLAANHELGFLLTRPDRPRGRGRRVGPPPAKEAALRLGIEVRQPEKLDESTDVSGVEAIVVVAYGALIPEVLLDRTLWLNVHPSLLPRWRGAAPVERAIMAGDAESGVTIHRTTAELDAGPIAAQRAFPISGEDAGAVYAKAGAVAAELLERVGGARIPSAARGGNDLRGTLDRGRPGARLGPTAPGAPQPHPRALAAHRGERDRGRQTAHGVARSARRARVEVDRRRAWATRGAGRGEAPDDRRGIPAWSPLTDGASTGRCRRTRRSRLKGSEDGLERLGTRSEIEPSIYAADFSRLGDQLESLLRAGARIFQFDVGDGHFVEPITIGPIVLKSISPIVHRFGGVLDCHLMVETPEKHFRQIAEAGGDSVTVHFEACDDLPGVIRQARELGLGAGVAFNPETEPDDVVAVAGELVDLVLCMSIHPGYSGQPFMPEAFRRVRRLRELLPEGVHVQVDGGVGQDQRGRDPRSRREPPRCRHERLRRGGHRGRIPAARPGDRLMLERALELAERGRGTTHPNPVVGAVVVREGRSWAKGGTSGREGRTPKWSRSTQRASLPGARLST